MSDMTFYIDISDLADVSDSKLVDCLKKVSINEELSNKRRETLLGRVMLGYLLKIHCGLDCYELFFNKNGKPYLKNRDLYFNISHSGNYIVCALDANEIGCDVQAVIAYNPRVASRFFCQAETDYINRCENREEIFFRLWALKESILKAKGGSIADGLDLYDFGRFAESGSFNCYGFKFSVFELKDAFVSVCAINKENELKKIDGNKLVDYVNKVVIS